MPVREVAVRGYREARPVLAGSAGVGPLVGEPVELLLPSNVPPTSRTNRPATVNSETHRS